MVIVSLAIARYSCVELRTAGVLVRAGLPSAAERSTKKHVILWMEKAHRKK